MKRLTRYALVVVAFLAAILPLSSASAAPTTGTGGCAPMRRPSTGITTPWSGNA